MKQKKIKILKFRESFKYFTVFFQIKKKRLKFLYAVILYRLFRKNIFPSTEMNLFGKKFFTRKNGTDIAILSSFYERDSTKLILNLKKRVFLDVGAHIGRFSILGASNSSKTISIEPSKRNFNLLKKNIIANRLSNKIDLINIGISNESGEKDLFFYKGDEGLSSFLKYPEERDNIKETCKVEKLDNLVKMQGIQIDEIDVIKIDVEGLELEVLKSSENILNEGHPLLIIETLTEKIKNDISNFLRKFGYKLDQVLDGRNAIFKKIK